MVLDSGVAPSWTANAVPYRRPVQMFTPDHLALPAWSRVRYDDAMGRISQIRDAINLQVGDHTVAGGCDPTSFYIADGWRGERDDPLRARRMRCTTTPGYNHPARYIDELGRETDQLADGLGRVVSTTYPEGDQEVFTYDGRNNPDQPARCTFRGRPGRRRGYRGCKSLFVSVQYTEGLSSFVLRHAHDLQQAAD